MNLEEAKKLFERRKYSYTSGILPSNKPVAYILGGQPSSGKSSLSNFYQDELNTLVINGDLYRGLHPNYNELVAQPLTYSRETQLLSNVFTEGLIDEAILNRVSVSVEGTMRRSEVVEATIDKFKDADFFVELLCIAAPKEYTAINLYYRYANELVLKGEGRLADIKSHNEAYEGILSTLDQAFYSKKADRIRLYEIFGRRQIIDYQKKGEQWSIQELPSSIVKKSRYSQLLDTSLALRMVEKGVEALFVIQEKDLRKDLQDKLQELIELLKSHTYENATLYQEKPKFNIEVQFLLSLDDYRSAAPFPTKEGRPHARRG